MLNYRNVRRRAEKRGCVLGRPERSDRQQTCEYRGRGAGAAGAKDGGWNLSREAANVGRVYEEKESLLYLILTVTRRRWECEYIDRRYEREQLWIYTCCVLCTPCSACLGCCCCCYCCCYCICFACALDTAATTSASSALAVAVAPSALPAPDVLLPTAGAVHAAATSSTIGADWLQRAGAAAK
jgi:hypothetical protein